MEAQRKEDEINLQLELVRARKAEELLKIKKKKEQDEKRRLEREEKKRLAQEAAAKLEQAKIQEQIRLKEAEEKALEEEARRIAQIEEAKRARAAQSARQSSPKNVRKLNVHTEVSPQTTPTIHTKPFSSGTPPGISISPPGITITKYGPTTAPAALGVSYIDPHAPRNVLPYAFNQPAPQNFRHQPLIDPHVHGAPYRQNQGLVRATREIQNELGIGKNVFSSTNSWPEKNCGVIGERVKILHEDNDFEGVLNEIRNYELF